MKIELIKMTIKNFKGIKQLNIDFSKVTNIYGENATGKTTIFDGFCWLLFGKDSKGRSSFEVQPLDNHNDVLHGLDTNITAILNVGGRDKEFSRTLSEKWVKQRGQAEAELKGCSTNYEIDGVPVKQKDYVSAINELINEDLFKMVTNPLYFPTIKWQDQRKILLDIIGDLDNESVINYNTSLSPLKNLLDDGIDNFNKKTKASISKLNKQIETIPTRIDECNNSIVVMDFTILEEKKKELEGKIEKVEGEILDSNKKSDEKLKLQEQLYKLKCQEQELQVKAIDEADKPRRELEQQIISKIDAIGVLKTVISTNEHSRDVHQADKDDLLIQIDRRKKKQDELRTKFSKIAAEEFTFDETLTVCPCCGRAYDMDKIEDIKSNALELFTSNKNKKLADINREGTMIGNEIKKYNSQLSESSKRIDDLTTKVTENSKKLEIINKELEELEAKKSEFNKVVEIKIPGLEEVQFKINSLNNEIAKYDDKNNIYLINQKKTYQSELNEINKSLNNKDNNVKLLARIEELKEEEKDLNVKKAELEKQQFLGEEFIKTKVELLEGEINKKFDGAVAFKLFNQQVNGGISECCEALIDGVPFGNANTAGQINAGLSIINTLCNHYDVQVPIFIDNRESVNKLVNSNNQIINLVVSKDKTMKVEVEE